MSSSGNGADATVLRSGMAIVKPISAIMPRTTDRPSPQSTPRGTLRTGLTASSDMSAASSNPTRVKMPSRLASAKAYQVGLWKADVVLNRMPAPVRRGLGVHAPQHEQQHAEYDGPDDLGEHRDVVDPRGDLDADDVDHHGQQHQDDRHREHQARARVVDVE